LDRKVPSIFTLTFRGKDETNGKLRWFLITKDEPFVSEARSDDVRPAIVKGSGFAVNGVSAVNASDIDEIQLTGTAKSAVSGTVTAVNVPGEEVLSSKIPAQDLWFPPMPEYFHFEQIVDISNSIQVQEKCARSIVANPYFFVDIVQIGEYRVSMYCIHGHLTS
jgi:hypothetical protein